MALMFIYDNFLDWTLATMYNLNGKDGKEDFDLLQGGGEISLFPYSVFFFENKSIKKEC